MIINRDEFKSEIITCGLMDGDECISNDCRICEVYDENRIKSPSELTAEREQKEAVEKKLYTEYEKSGKLHDVPIKTNYNNTVARIDMQTTRQLQEKRYISVTPFYKKLDELIEYPSFQKLRYHNNLDIPDEVWINKSMPGVFRFGDVVFLVAPRIKWGD